MTHSIDTKICARYVRLTRDSLSGEGVVNTVHDGQRVQLCVRHLQRLLQGPRRGVPQDGGRTDEGHASVLVEDAAGPSHADSS